MPDIFGDLEVKTKIKLDKPSFWDVVLLNDNYTSMDFVVFVLFDVFGKNLAEAQKIMLLIHNNGKGIAGTYTFEVAQQKALETMSLAKANGHPLTAVVEESK
jgi:ATP-dependent Clp protease adaptor protein ClpS